MNDNQKYCHGMQLDILEHFIVHASTHHGKTSAKKFRIRYFVFRDRHKGKVLK